MPEPLTCEPALKTTALAATLLFVHGQTTQNGRLLPPSGLGAPA